VFMPIDHKHWITDCCSSSARSINGTPILKVTQQTLSCKQKQCKPTRWKWGMVHTHHVSVLLTSVPCNIKSSAIFSFSLYIYRKLLIEISQSVNDWMTMCEMQSIILWGSARMTWWAGYLVIKTDVTGGWRKLHNEEFQNL
jgi:hypothetical protein